MLVRRDTGLAAGVDSVTVHPVPKAGFADPEVTRGRRIGIALSNKIEGSTPELRRVGSRHVTDSFRDDHRLKVGVRKSGSGSVRQANVLRNVYVGSMLAPERVSFAPLLGPHRPGGFYTSDRRTNIGSGVIATQRKWEGVVRW